MKKPKRSDFLNTRDEALLVKYKKPYYMNTKINEHWEHVHAMYHERDYIEVMAEYNKQSYGKKK